jgi:Replication-relaxation
LLGVRETDGTLRSASRNVRTTLRTLWEHGLLERPAAQYGDLLVHGMSPMVYRVTGKGLELLSDPAHKALTPAHVGWTGKPKLYGKKQWRHTLEISRVMTAIEVSCRAHGLQFVSEQQILDAAPESTRAVMQKKGAHEALRYVTDIPERLWLSGSKLVDDGGGKVSRSVVPDGLFGIAQPDGDIDFYFLELDRGTLPLIRSEMRRYGGREVYTPNLAHKKSIAGKLLTYWRGWNKGVPQHVSQLGKHTQNLRVLFVTTTLGVDAVNKVRVPLGDEAQERADLIRERRQNANGRKTRVDALLETTELVTGGGTRWFLFADLKHFVGKGIDPLEAPVSVRAKAGVEVTTMLGRRRRGEVEEFLEVMG